MGRNKTDTTKVRMVLKIFIGTCEVFNLGFFAKDTAT